MMTAASEYNFPSKKFKMVLLGASKVGKSSLITRFKENTFEDCYQATIGVDSLFAPMRFEGRDTRIQLFDTAGPERFHKFIPGHIRDSTMAVVVYDITNANSFDQASKWIDDVQTEHGSNVVVMLVGNKADLEEIRQVSTKKGEKKANDLNAMFIETSAKTGHNVRKLFRRVVTSASEYARTLKFKLAFLGEMNVGKTSLVNRFMYDVFDKTYRATLGINFLRKSMYLEDRNIQLQLWDTTGQARFRRLIPGYVWRSTMAVIVYDITDVNSFHQTSKWIHDVRTERGSDAVIILVGNKTDLAEKRQVSTKEGEKKAKESFAMFIETSAKTGYQVNELFSGAVAALSGMNNNENEGKSEMVEVKLSDSRNVITTKEGECAS